MAPNADRGGPDLADDVMRTAERLVGAYADHDTRAYFDHFSEDATFIFHTTEQVLRSRAEYEALWARWERDDGFRVRSCRSSTRAVRVLGERAAVFTHDVSTTVDGHGGQETFAERETIVFERTGDRWLAVHEHLSPTPAPPGA